jgi:hypothetical protein
METEQLLRNQIEAIVKLTDEEFNFVLRYFETKTYRKNQYVVQAGAVDPLDHFVAKGIIGKAVGNQMNMGTTLAVFASICKEKNQPFTWLGSKAQWEGITDMTDANVLAKHLIWASTTEDAKNEAFNITNGDIFRWKWMWKQIADYFELEIVGYTGEIQPLEKQMEHDEEVWRAIVSKYNLKESNLSRLALPWHTDLDLSRPVEIMTDMSKSRKLGFKIYKPTIDSFIELFDELRTEKLIS